MKPHALPKEYLLRKNWEYRHVYSCGKRLHGSGFSLIFTANTLEHNRLGISIHGQLKGSVRRNRIKRIIREFYRLNRDFIAPSVDIVFTVRKGFVSQSPVEVGSAVAVLLSTLAPPVGMAEK